MQQFLRFLVAGGLGAVVNIVSRYVLNMAMSFDLAVVLAYGLGMITAFTISRVYAFRSREQSASTQFARFALVNVVAAFLVWLVSVTLARQLFPAIGFAFYPEDVAHIIAVGSTAVSSYVMHKHFTFSPRKTG